MIEAINFPNIGFLKVQLTDAQIAPILSEIREIENDFISAVEANKFLAGNIDKQYKLNKCHDYVNLLLKDLVQAYEDNFNLLSTQSPLSRSVPLFVNNVWVNFQSKHEFNPIHNHAGIISFVIWIKIPYKIKNENDNSPGKKSKLPLSGHFSFCYTNALGEICHYDIPADQSMENCILVFPAKMHHSVHPFYSSDDYRISVSGNVVFQI
jgi:AAA15 family ATPase/GTPase